MILFITWLYRLESHIFRFGSIKNELTPKSEDLGLQDTKLFTTIYSIIYDGLLISTWHMQWMEKIVLSFLNHDYTEEYE